VKDFFCCRPKSTSFLRSFHSATMKGDKGALYSALASWEPLQRFGERRNPTDTSTIQYDFAKGSQLKTQGSAGEQQIHIIYDTGKITHE
jgi:hypothetical protein